MKYIKFIVILLFPFILLSCKNKINYITDIDSYSNLNNNCISIDVSYDVNENTPYLFTINDKDDLNEIMSLILNTKLIKGGNKDGNHTTLKIYYDSFDVTINSQFVNYNDQIYYFENYNLYLKIQELSQKY